VIFAVGVSGGSLYKQLSVSYLLQPKLKLFWRQFARKIMTFTQGCGSKYGSGSMGLKNEEKVALFP
jgi:hypothetical protein